jgi:hypothetical protein
MCSRPTRGSSSGDAWGTTTQTLRYSDATELAAGDTLPATTRSGFTTVAAWGESAGTYSNARSSNGRSHSAAAAAAAAAVPVLRRSSVSSSTSSSSRRYSKGDSPVRVQQQQQYCYSSETLNAPVLYDATMNGGSSGNALFAARDAATASKHKHGGDLDAAERRALRRAVVAALAGTSLTVTEPTVSASSATVARAGADAAATVRLYSYQVAYSASGVFAINRETGSMRATTYENQSMVYCYMHGCYVVQRIHTATITDIDTHICLDSNNRKGLLLREYTQHWQQHQHQQQRH